MGKIRRERQKFHLTREHTDDAIPVVPVIKSVPGKPALPVKLDNTPSDIFAGVKISLPDLQQTLTPSATTTKVPLGTKSEGSLVVRKEQHLSKKAKRLLRRDELLRKIDTVHKLKQEAKARRKREKTALIGDIKPLLDALPSLVPHGDPKASTAGQKEKHKKNSIQKKPILSKKQRKKKELEDLKTFRSVLNNPHYKANPGTAITNFIERVIRKQ